MKNEECISFDIPIENQNHFIITRLFEIEAQNKQIINMVGELLYDSINKEESSETPEEFQDRVNDRMRKIRLELAAKHLKEFS